MTEDSARLSGSKRPREDDDYDGGTSYDQIAWFTTAKDPCPQRRARDVNTKKIEYAWVADVPDTVPYAKKLPASENSSATNNWHYNFVFDGLSTAAELVTEVVLGAVTKVVGNPGPFDVYHRLYQERYKSSPLVRYTWREDAEFAYQRLNGFNPMMIQKLDAIPAKFPLTDAIISGIEGLPADYNIARLLREKRLFIADWEDMESILGKCPPERNACAPMAIFYRQPGFERLMPLAIQLGQTPGPKFPIFTPKDPKGLWTVAKMHCQISDGAVHEVKHHLYNCHFIMEAIYTSLNRNVSVRHPISAWLTQHFFYLMNINYLARTELIGPTGAVPALFSFGYDGMVDLLCKTGRQLDFTYYDIPANLAKRGVADPELLPEYHYRDDALKVWGVISQFVERMVGAIFETDAELAADSEIQAWLTELQAPLGAGLGQGLGLRGIQADADKRITKRSDLSKFITQVIFAVSAQHSAVNNGQFDYMGFVPNFPYFMSMPPPVDRIDIPDEAIARALPSPWQTKRGIEFVHVLTIPTKDLLGSYDGPFFQERTYKRIVTDFQERLVALSAAFQTRNDTLKRAYTYLDPVQIPMAVST